MNENQEKTGVSFMERSWLAIIIFSFALPSYAALNKWVDEEGKVHYGDRVPPKYLKKEREVLNEQGVIIRKHEAPKTEEELLLEAKQKAKLDAENKKKIIAERKAALRDRVLLDTFTKVRDIDIARDARIDSVDSQIRLTETIIKDQEIKLQQVKKRIANLEEIGREVPENLHKEVTAVSRQLETHYQYVETKTEEREQIIKSFEEDKKRFMELKELQRKKKEQDKLNLP